MSSELLKQAFAALDAGRAEEATALLKDYLWRDPSDGVAYAALGVALSQLGQAEAALEAMEQAHYLRPLDARVLYNYGLVLAASGDPKGARVRFAAALKVDPHYDRASRCLAQLEARTSRTAIPESFPSVDNQERTLALAVHEPARDDTITDAVFVAEMPPDMLLPAEPPVREAVSAPANGNYGPGRAFPVAQAALETEPAAPAPPVIEVAAPTPTPEAPPPPRIAHTPMAATLARAAAAPPKAAPPLVTTPPKPPSRLGTGLMLVGSTAALAAALAYVLWPSPSSSSSPPPGTRPSTGDALVQPGRMRGGDFSGGNLRQRKLGGEDLQDARLTRADLSGSDLTEANLMGVDATDAFFRGTDLTRAKLLRSTLERADLEGAFLRATDLSGAKLASARLVRAYLHSATLSAADLSRADLQRANLTDARLDSAKLVGADLRGANLQGADLSNAFLDGARFQGAQYDASTLWPIGFDPAEERAVLAAGGGAAAAPRGERP